MTVKSVLTLAASNLGREDLVAAVCDADEEPYCGEVQALLRCYLLVENEVALDYFPLKTEEVFKDCGKSLPYSRFEKPPVKILSVCSEEGKVPFEERPAHLLLPEGKRGTYTIFYAYAPADKGISDECEVCEGVSARLLSYGLDSEYLLSCGRFAEAATWEKKYRDALRAAATPKRPLFIRSRRWA